jgi:hypothetical protein
MGCFLGVTINRRKPLTSPHAHEGVSAGVDPGVLSCTRNQRAFDKGPPQHAGPPDIYVLAIEGMHIN